MGKKKKKGKKDSADSIEEAVKTSEEDKSALMALLSGGSEGVGFYSRKKDEEINPILALEDVEIQDKSQVALDYIMEDKPLSQLGSIKKRTPLVPLKEDEEDPLPPDSTILPPPPSSVVAEGPTAAPREYISLESSGQMYQKLAEFFENLINGYEQRYNSWENSISNLLAILRKMRKITKKNTEDLVGSIENMYQKTTSGLDQFKIKRNQVEKAAEVNIENMSSEFKNVLGLLELQIKEYQMKKETDEYVHLRHLLS